MRRWFLCILIGLGASALQAQSTAFDRTLDRGIDAFYATDWVKADSAFNALIRSHPQDPRPYFFSSMIPFWAYFFAGNDSQYGASFLKRSETAIQVGMKHLETSPGDTSIVLLMSGLHGYRSLVAASEKEYRIAIQSGMKGYSYTKQLMAYGDANPNAMMGQGVFQYMVGSIPGEIRWMATIAGLSGDKQAGLNLLRQVATGTSDVKYDAMMVMAHVMEKEDRPMDAITYLDMLVTHQPKNIIAVYHLARLREATGSYTDARKGYMAVLQTKLPEFALIRQESRSKLLLIANRINAQHSASPIH